MNLFGFLSCCLISCTVLAQQSVNSSGGDLSSGSGSVAYSVGQVFFSNYSTSDGMVSKGVQQPLEVYTLGIEDEFEASFTMYPNPVEDRLHIQLLSASHQQLNYSLYSMTGRLLKKGELESDLTVVPLNHLSTGTYLLQLSSQNQQVFTKKIIKK